MSTAIDELPHCRNDREMMAENDPRHRNFLEIYLSVKWFQDVTNALFKSCENIVKIVKIDPVKITMWRYLVLQIWEQQKQLLRKQALTQISGLVFYYNECVVCVLF